jgi:hypothetical protein
LDLGPLDFGPTRLMKLHLHGPFLDGQTDEASQYMETMIQTWHIKME